MDTPKMPPGQEGWEPFFNDLFTDASRRYKREDADAAVKRIEQLCADHYRCAWLDEVQRLHDGMRLKEFPGDIEDLQAAWQHAEAWRVWGAGK